MRLTRRVSMLAESATLAVVAQAARLKASGVDVVGFGAGEPDFDTPDHIKDAGIAALHAGHTGYPKPTSGIDVAKHAVCAKLARENGLHYDPDQVIITAGGKMGVYLAVHALVDPGDEVVIPRPYWVSYPEIVKLAGGVPVFVAGPEERGYKLAPRDLLAAMTDRTRLVVLNSPCNPGGAAYTTGETRALADALATWDTWVLSDEIYDRLVYGGHDVLSFAAAGDAAFRQTITLNGASKTYAMTGWRVGYAAGDRDAVRAMAKLQSQTTSGAATFTQHALAAALTGDQDVVETMRTAFERRGAFMWERLSAMPGVRCVRPNGAFYCFPNVSDTYQRLGVAGSAAFADKLLSEAHVAVVPGVAFGLDGHVRLSFATGTERIEEGLRRLEAFVRG
ncbi:MAG: pyridoxal phosphate-dependent aminotransferase [Phycisphaerae bacterium]